MEKIGQEAPESLPHGSGAYQNPAKWLSGWVKELWSSPEGNALALMG
jgi:hypothetical protein